MQNLREQYLCCKLVRGEASCVIFMRLFSSFSPPHQLFLCVQSLRVYTVRVHTDEGGALTESNHARSSEGELREIKRLARRNRKDVASMSSVNARRTQMAGAFHQTYETK